MRTVSTGVGLCVLGVCVLGAAALSSPRLDNAASAAGVYAVESDLSKSIASACDPASLQWFSPTIRTLRFCTGDYEGVGAQSFGSADVNGDGTLELLGATQGEVGTFLTRNGAMHPEFKDIFLYTMIRQIDGQGEIKLDRKVVFSVRDVAQSVLQQFPGVNEVQLLMQQGTSGLADVDGDGDLDIVCRLSGIQGLSQVWFENTGFQKAPAPNPYDLDQDGEVGAGDISVLLLNFD